MKQALTIAGSDSSGGAGIQADLKTFQALGVFGASVVTAVTAQNTREVRAALDLPPDLIRAQLDAVFEDLDVAAVKTGMLSSVAIIETVAAALSARGVDRLVVDPVMISKSGYRLLRDEAVAALRDSLLPLALVATPNLHEAAALAAMPIESVEDMKRAGERIRALGPRAVVVKGGHAAFALATDVLVTEECIDVLHPDRPARERSVHGTGCTFSAAITARLALGDGLGDAVRRAKRYVTRAIENAPNVGHGSPPGHHFYFLEPDDWDT